MDHAPALTPERVLRRLEWRVVRRLDGLLQGDYRTLFRGSGIDFRDLREYEPGDDLRHIDWNVTARMDAPYVRQYVEDREVTAWLLLDRSASMGFGPVERQKHLVVAETAGTIAQLLARGGNRFGAVLFDTDNRVETIPPGQGRNQVLRILARLLDDGTAGSAHQDAGPAPTPTPTAASGSPSRPGTRGAPGTPRATRSWRRRGRHARQPEHPTTDLAVLLRAAGAVAVRRALVVVVSDFITEPGWERPLALLGHRHDVVALQVTDPRESELPAVGMVYVEDAETGEQIFVDTDDAAFRHRVTRAAAERQAALAEGARSAGVDLFTIGTDEDLVRALIRISALRGRRR